MSILGFCRNAFQFRVYTQITQYTVYFLNKVYICYLGYYLAEISQESKCLPKGGLPYLIFYVYAPAVQQNLLSLLEDLHVKADVNSRLCYIYNLLFTLHSVQSTCLQYYIIYF